MTQFKRAIYQLLRLSPKIRQPLLHVTPTAHTAVTEREPICLPKIAHLELRSQFQPLTDTDTKEVEEDKECDDGDDSDEKDEKDEKDDEKEIPEAVPYHLTPEARIEMMIHRLHVATADSDLEIATLRTRQHETFTHIVRIMFAPPLPADNVNNVAPSNWAWEEIRPSAAAQGSGPSEFRLTCPAYSRGLGDHSSALTVHQLLAARKYITCALSDGNAGWEKKGRLEFPPLPASECAEDARLLIVGPTNRSADVMAVLVCYLAFLTGMSTKTLLDGVQKSLVHHQWRFSALGETCVGVADKAVEHM